MQKIPFNQEWRFQLGDREPHDWHDPDDFSWRVLNLPHDWSIELERSAENPSGNAGGYFPMGRARYRKTFSAPKEWAGKKVWVEFEGVYMNAEVWLNEHFLGRHPYGYTTFHFDLTPYLLLGAKNVLKVLVDNASQLNSRWYSGSGIYRPVWLLAADPVHTGFWGVSITTPKVTPETASVRGETTVENQSESVQDVMLRSNMLAPDGSVVGTAESHATIEAGGAYKFTQNVHIPHPKMWSSNAPILYRWETEVRIDRKVVDTSSTSFGIRSVSFDAENGFLLNGQPLKLKGGCVHHDNGVLGSASYRRSEERKVELLKASGFNAIRCAHNPPAPAFLDACDRLGMLVIDEAFDCWRDGKNPYDYHVAFDDWWQRDIESMVHRDFNHPSIILWSIGNELIERGRPEGFEIAHKLADHVRRLDPTRPVTAAMCGPWNDQWSWPVSEGFFTALDVGGYNYQWQHYQTDHEKFPRRVMVGTESFPMEAFENWSSVQENAYVIGDFVWTSLDYLGESGIGRVHYGGELEQFLGQYPWHQAFCGDLDLCGFKRPQSYYRDILWGNGEKLYIAVHHPTPRGKTPVITRWGWPDVIASWTWPGHKGKILKLDVYSACEKVELFLNGKSLGIQPSSKQEKHTASFEVRYQPGELKAVGYNAGIPVAECSLHTTGSPAQIRLTPDRETLQAGADDLCYVTVEMLDKEGRLNPTSRTQIKFTVSGEGALAAIGSGNPQSEESYSTNHRKAFHGRCLAVIKTTGKAGEIRLKAQAEALDAAELILQAA